MITSTISSLHSKLGFNPPEKKFSKTIKHIFKHGNDIEWLSKRIKGNVLANLPELQRRLVISFLEESHVLDRALAIGESEVVSILLNAGYDAKKCEIRSHTKIEDPLLAKQLVASKASSNIIFFQDKCKSSIDQIAWIEVLCNILADCHSTQYNFLDLIQLMKLAQTHENLKKVLTELLQKWVEQDIEGLILRTHLTKTSDNQGLKILLDSWTLGIFPSKALESLFLHPEFLYWSNNHAISKTFNQEAWWNAMSPTRYGYRLASWVCRA